MQCKYCNKEIKSRIHESLCKNNSNRRKQWNEGKTNVYSKEQIKRLSDVAKARSAKGELGRAATEEKELLRRKKISDTMKQNPNAGGLRHGSGRGKKGWYKGFFCDSSWELAYVIYCLDSNINIIRNTTKLQYEWNGVVKNYTPDFIVNNTLVEIKGYKTLQWEAKLKSNPNVITLYEADIKPILNYVHNTYGKDFIRLYETNGSGPDGRGACLENK